MGLDEAKDEARALYLPWEPLRVHGGPWSQLCSGPRGKEPLILLPESYSLSPEQTSWGKRTRRQWSPQSSRTTQPVIPGWSGEQWVLIVSPWPLWDVIKVMGHLHTHTRTHCVCWQGCDDRNGCLSYGLERDVYLLPDRLVLRDSSWAHLQLWKALTIYWESLIQAPSFAANTIQKLRPKPYQTSNHKGKIVSCNQCHITLIISRHLLKVHRDWPGAGPARE